MFQNKSTPHPRKETYSYQSAQARITMLQNQGYHLVGSLPDKEEPWSALKTASFLFIKDAQYYQYQAKSLLSDTQSKLCFDEAQIPNIKGFSKIITNDYIYVICPHKTLENANAVAKPLLLLRKDTSKSGHDFLIAPYKKYAEEDKIVGGELYYLNGEFLLINRKSGSFPKSEAEALASISTIFGPKGQAAYHSAVEVEEVQEEIRKRSIRNLPSACAAPSSPSLLNYHNPNRVLPLTQEPPRPIYQAPPIAAPKASSPVLRYSFSLDSPGTKPPPVRIAWESNMSQQRFFNNKSPTIAHPISCAKSCTIL
ncbi:hypothetical protein ACD661_06750 [Legionella lytica]|uniref:Uncharacterized protein n=1 Tax=Legionella lytica TaxID=96232 RepID=A0ABW8D6C6_9GAMM